MWQDSRDGRPQIYAARSTDGGATFDSASPVAPSPDAQIAPSAAATGASVYVAWQERDAAEQRVVAALSKDGGASFGPRVAVATDGDDPDA